jgi:hypothetical protein
MGQIEFNLGATPHHVTLTEVAFLLELLHTERSLGATLLQRSVREAAGNENPRAIRLGLDDIEALRAVLCRDNFAGFPGLDGLKTSLCRQADA